MAEHYVDNQRFLLEMTEYQNERKTAKENGIELPPCPDYIGECFLKIAQRLSFRPNFINYAFREDMISDGIENCVQYMNNFNPEKSKNPFAYFTQIIYYAFVRRIEREKKQAYVKHKLSEQMIEEKRIALYDDYDDSMVKGMLDHVKPNEGFDVEDYENKMVQKREQRKKNKKSVIERFME